jgi:DNA invertase Pin-like site-specific DNA recombinase
MSKGKVYSYVRFSDPKQALGSSADRQTQYAEKWASERGLALDKSLSLRDEGLSAFHQKHIKQGALGAFLLAVNEGKINPGSVLIVEGLDRLSRAEPIQAQAQLAQIINANITVVTASDGKEYNREHLKANPMDLVYSLLVMIRAHEESDTKSKRVIAAIKKQCQGWQDGTFRGVIRNGKDPHWVSWNGSEFELVHERSEAVRLVIDQYLKGYGGDKILKELKIRGLQISNEGSSKPTLYKLLKRPNLIGIKEIEVGNVQFRLEGYYPALITEKTYVELQALNNERVKNKGKGEIPSIVSGMQLLFCGYCGAAVVAQNLMSRKRKSDGNPQDGHRRLICCGASNNNSCSVGGSCSVVPIERAILNYCSDQFNLTSLISDKDNIDEIASKNASLKKQIIELERQLTKLTEALLSSDESEQPMAFVKKARELEDQISAMKAQEKSSSIEATMLRNRHTPEIAKVWADLKNAALLLDEDARMHARKLVKETFERIVLYHRGFQPSEFDGKSIGLLLIAKNGRPRLLQVDRHTGEWRSGEEFIHAVI